MKQNHTFLGLFNLLIIILIIKLVALHAAFIIIA